MKDLEKLLMQGPDESNDMDSDVPAKPAMTKQSFSAKLDVIRDLMDEMQLAMGGQVKGGLDELIAGMAAPDVGAPAPAGLPSEASVGMPMDESSMDEVEDSEPEVEAEAEKEMVAEPEVVAKENKKDEEDDSDDTFFGKKKDKKKFF